MGVADALRAAFRRWDAQIARSELAAFEGRTGRRGAAGLGILSVSDAALALRPEGRPLLEHHTTLGAAGGDVDVLRELAARGDIDVVLVLWDAARRGEPTSDEHGAAQAVVAGAPGLRAWLLRPPGDPTTAFRLSLDALPQTRLTDRDGGVLRTWRGPLGAAEARSVLSVIGGRSPDAKGRSG